MKTFRRHWKYFFNLKKLISDILIEEAALDGKLYGDMRSVPAPNTDIKKKHTQELK